MSTRFRLFTKRFFIYSNVALVFVFLLACLAPYLNPKKWWFISLLGLGFPVLLLIVLLFLIGWLILLKPKVALISGVALLLGLKSISVFFAFHIPQTFDNKKSSPTLRIATWNVAMFIDPKKNNQEASHTRWKMMDLIRQQDADIVCLQEFFHSFDTAWYSNINYITDSLKYPYWYFSDQSNGDLHYLGAIIFSRYPIIDSGRIRFPKPTLPEAMIYADIKINTDTIRVFTTHLQSFRFDSLDYERIGQIENSSNVMSYGSRNILTKIKKAAFLRSIQTDIIHQALQNHPWPVLFCGDLNDVPNSYTYFKIKNGMQDAFLKKGMGMGRTFSGISPTLRIDYIFADKNFEIKQFNRHVKNYSDHYMLIADVLLKKRN